MHRGLPYSCIVASTGSVPCSRDPVDLIHLFSDRPLQPFVSGRQLLIVGRRLYEEVKPNAPSFYSPSALSLSVNPTFLDSGPTDVTSTFALLLKVKLHSKTSGNLFWLALFGRWFGEKRLWIVALYQNHL